MTPLAGLPVVTAAAMRAAEDAVVARGTSVIELMDRAGKAVAEAVWRLGGDSPVLVLCGPGNNGGDGYVAAAALAARGVPVRVAASAPPGTEAARHARLGWQGPVEALADAVPAPVLVDALFGTGLSRPLDAAINQPLVALARAASMSITVDVPSGVGTDDGKLLADVPVFDVTLALGAAKPAHLLQPSARHCGSVRPLDIGIPVTSDLRVLGRPVLPPPDADAHKYSRGMVAVIAGVMPGAAELAAEAAMRAGAGYVLLLGPGGPIAPHAIVRRPWDADALTDKRIGAVLVGPGLGRDGDAVARLDAAIACPHALVIDGDALHMLDEHRLDKLAARGAPTALTPHPGEFTALFGTPDGSKIDAARAAAQRAGAFVVFKGADTVIAAPDGQIRLAEPASTWLSTAGTGDVLAGTIAAMLSSGKSPTLDRIGAGVWLHAEAARRLGGAFIADDLAAELTIVRGSL
ncbi:NAD(P)H-hydrate dehydratase [Sphingomonas sp. AR_OL41]|uniref:NAD(P)H-hydrate dehydratase n=1 Tax=Sphingomonas sp. AR_OL41 TaxID=3042729 RepID=UPI00248048B4|nr:NAD(P)H-hydrate dehydratase [Sphingomonas sp. AR_OL41]MDH7970887.1 NAD(P)H-hydrate dehydratase [Sphingomonas sp. AR_OL41]